MDKKNWILLLILLTNFSNVVCARNVSKTIRAKNSNRISVKPIQNQVNENNQKIELSCEEKFFNCMDGVCLNNQGIRFNCSQTLDTFETIQKDGNNIRLGNDLYTYAKGTCLSVLKSCELKDQNTIENRYKAQIQTDLLTKNYMDAMAYNGEKASQEALQSYIQCMQPLCGTNFKDCLTISNIERRASKCENVLEKTNRKLAVKKAFYEEMEKLNISYCQSMNGTIDYDDKICKVKVVFGVPKTSWEDGVEYIDPNGAMEKELTSKMFNVGEVVECTQEYFATFYEENENKAKGIVQMISGITKAVGGVVTTIVGAVLGGNTSLIGSGIKLMTSGTADSLDGYIKIDNGTKKGACYINNKYVAPMGQYFKINFMQ